MQNNYHPDLTNSEVGALEDFNRANQAFAVAYAPRKKRFVLYSAQGQPLESKPDLWEVLESPVLLGADSEVERLRA